METIWEGPVPWASLSTEWQKTLGIVGYGSSPTAKNAEAHRPWLRLIRGPNSKGVTVEVTQYAHGSQWVNLSEPQEVIGGSNEIQQAELGLKNAQIAVYQNQLKDPYIAAVDEQVGRGTITAAAGADLVRGYLSRKATGADSGDALQVAQLSAQTTRQASGANLVQSLFDTFRKLAENARPEDGEKVANGFVAAIGLANYLADKWGGSVPNPAQGFLSAGSGFGGATVPPPPLAPPPGSPATLPGGALSLETEPGAAGLTASPDTINTNVGPTGQVVARPAPDNVEPLPLPPAPITGPVGPRGPAGATPPFQAAAATGESTFGSPGAEEPLVSVEDAMVALHDLFGGGA